MTGSCHTNFDKPFVFAKLINFHYTSKQGKFWRFELQHVP